MATLSRALTARNQTRLDFVAELVALILHGLLVVCVVAVMRRVDSGDRASVLAPLAIGGLVLGYSLSRTFVQDMFAHSVALWTGATASVLTVAIVTTGPVEIVRSRGQGILDLISGIGRSIYGDRQNQVTDYEMLAVLGLTAWLLAYSSAWVIYRRGWFGLGVAVPAVILLTSIRVDDRTGGWPLAIFVFAAIGLAARQAIVANSARWARRNMDAGKGLTSRFLFSGLPIAVLAVVVAVALNPATHDALNVPYRERAQSGWNSARDQVLEALGVEGTGKAGYASFPESFEIGGDIDLGTEVVARVEADGEHYLALRRYDVYTGRGWTTDVESTFRLEGESSDLQVTNVIFAGSQSVALSANVTDKRVINSAVITVVNPRDDLIFTIETFSSASEKVFAVLGWRILDDLAFDVDQVELGAVPVDLQGLIRTVRNAPFALDEATGAVQLTDGAVQEAFDRARAQLLSYPVTAELAVGNNGQLLVIVSGRIPNYDDVEALFTSETLKANVDYQVVGLKSIAMPDDLARASTDYPAWVANRYLQLPGSVTERTRTAAQNVVIRADAQNPFDQVYAIQEFLRSEYSYELNGPGPPSGQDWVDYFLFDHKAGRCEQFASSMVVMVRALGIPARLVSGFNYSGETDAAGDVIYRENQAHTWVEVYFPGYGWIPFEPTTNRAEFTFGGEGQGELASADVGAEGTPTPTPIPETGPDATPTAEATPNLPQLALDQGGDGGSGMSWWVKVAAILTGVASIGIAGFVALRWQWRVRGLSPAGGLFARVQRVGLWFGVRASDSTTPYEYSRAFTRVLPGSEPAVRSITNAWYAEQFDPASTDQDSLTAARSGWKQLRRNLLRWRLRRPKRR